MTSLSASRRNQPDRLFCYGTLCLPGIMRRASGTLPAYTEASLTDFASFSLSGRDYPAIVPAAGAGVAGILYEGLGRAQWTRLDRYEGPEYQRLRVWVETAEGQQRQAWAYVLRPRYYHRRGRRSWSLAQFRQEKLYLYLAHYHYR